MDDYSIASLFFMTTQSLHSSTTTVPIAPSTRMGLYLPFLKGRRWVPLARIVRLEGIGNYTRVFFTDGTDLLVALTLKVLEDRLPAETMIRPHRKHLLNWQYVRAVHPILQEVMLYNGERFSLARRRVSEVSQAYRLRSWVA